VTVILRQSLSNRQRESDSVLEDGRQGRRPHSNPVGLASVPVTFAIFNMLHHVIE